MSVSPELHDKLGEVIGLMQAVRLMVRKLAFRIEPEHELAPLLQRISGEVEELQRRCDSFVASHSEIKQSRVTGTARGIKSKAACRIESSIATTELLGLLVLIAEDLLTGWRAVAALAGSTHESPVATLVRAATLLHTEHVQELTPYLTC